MIGSKKLQGLLACVMALGACESSSSAPPAEGAKALPADVQAVVDSNCRRCHGEAPSFGAPMSIVTYEAMHARAVTRPDLFVYQLVGERIHDVTRPMPPTGLLSESERAILDAWIAKGAPAGAGTAQDGGAEGPDVGPEHLPCTPKAEFRAFAPGAPDQPYALTESGNVTNCYVFESPFAKGEQATAFAPIIDDKRVLHHWIIFGSSTLPPGRKPGDVYECGTGGMNAGTRFLTGWAPGGLNAVYPESQGRELPGPGEYVILQVHYWNVRGYQDVRDKSGVAACTTTTPRPNLVGTSTLGSLAITIPPRTRDFEVVGTCTPDITAPVTIVASGAHMHTRGRSFKTEVLRGGREDAVETLVSIANWDFNQQAGDDAPGGALVINPGDVLRTRCTYDNESEKAIYFGERTEDEMCFNFVSAYPAGVLANKAGRASRLCID
jgi:hypothetical protein